MGRYQISIQKLMAVVVTGAVLGWTMRQLGPDADLARLGLPMACLACPLLMLGWSIARVYHSPPDRQTAPIVGLVASTMALLVGLLMTIALLAK